MPYRVSRFLWVFSLISSVAWFATLVLLLGKCKISEATTYLRSRSTAV